MSNVKVVIGANFGDEGKGLMTDYFCAEATKRNESCIVALCNGGAQRGHTVVTPDGIRHVFHHFGSGTLAGADTYLSEKYILNPMTFRKEYEELEAIGFSPKVYAHPSCMWSTPYDMIANQIIEDSRGNNRHGSCGMGIWETLVRYAHTKAPWNLQRYNDEDNKKKIIYLEAIRNVYINSRLKELNVEIPDNWKAIYWSNTMIEHFINDVAFMCKHITWVYDDVLNTYDNIVFENGQGLLLDQNRTEYRDNTTPSNTGIKNPHEIINKTLPNANVEVCYVTRTYLTRHGAGKFEEECDKSEINAKMEDKTNVPNPYQGSIRYGKLDISSLFNRIQNDINSVDGDSYNISLAITHLNEYENEILLSQKRFEKIYLSNNETRKMKRRTNSMSITNIDKNKFIRYVKVQASGVCNMWSSEVQDRAGLTKEEHMDIIKNYDSYEKEFDVHVEDYM